MQVLFEQFVRERKYLKNVTPRTEAWYWQSWKALVGDATSVQSSKAFWTERIAHLRERGVAAITVNAYTRAMNAFLHCRPVRC